MPYFEWCLDNMKEDLLRQTEKSESQEVLLEPGSNALYVLQPTTSMVGFIASKSTPDKYLRHKLSMPALFEKANKQRQWHHDPASGLLHELTFTEHSSVSLSYIMGCAFYEAEAKNLVKSYLKPQL